MSPRSIAARRQMRPLPSGDCGCICPGGRPCICDARPHDLHICSEALCPCHSQQRYARLRVERGEGRIIRSATHQEES